MTANYADAPPYAKWNALLRGEKVELYESECEAGFWRGREFRGGPLVGIATWPEGGRMIAVRGGALVAPEKVWPDCAKRPVYEEYYRVWQDTGVWPDEHPLRGTAAPDSNEPPDEHAMLVDQVQSALAGVADYSSIADDAAAARAQSLRARLNELSREADKRREALKKPHLDAGKRVDARWQPLVKGAKEGAETLAKSLSSYATAQARAAEEARRLAEAEQKRAEDEARRAREAGQETREEPPASPPELPRVATTIKGAYGRAASVKVVRIARIRDIDQAFQFFRKDEIVIEAILLAAQRQVNAGITPPGIEVDEERRVS